MSSADAAVAAASGTGPSARSTLPALFGLLLRTQVSLARLLGIGALGGLAVLIGLFARWDANTAQAAADGIASYGLHILVPLAALWLGTSALGDLVEDRLLVYLWLKPVPRWVLPAAAVLATTAVVVPLTAGALVVSALVAGAGGVAWSTAVAASLAGLAYSGLFVAAGLWFRRAVWWGLAFILVWETVVAATAEGAARFTVVGWASALLGTAAGIDVRHEAGSAAAAFVVLPAVAVAGWLAATWRSARADVD